MRFFELFGVLPSNSKVKGLRFFEIFLNFSDFFFLRIVSNSKFKDLSFFYIFDFFYFFFVFFVFSLDSKQLSFAKHLSMFFPFL